MSESSFVTTLVPIDKIKPPMFQCRGASLDENLDELVESVKTVGLLQPLTVRPDKEEQFELVLGSRRLKACQKAGLTFVPAIVRDLTDEEALEIEGSENLNRNDLSAEEKTRLVSEWARRGYDAKTIATKVHKSYSWVTSFLPTEFKDKVKVEAGKLGGEAKASATIIVAENKADSGKGQDLHGTPNRESQDSSAIATAQQEHTIKTQDTAIQEASIHKVAPKVFDRAEFVECERCHIKTSEPKQWHGHTLCSKCFERAEYNPVAYDGYFKMLERGKTAVTTQPKVTAPSIESYKDREARMHPQKSNMEQELLVILGNDEALRPVVTDRGYPIVTVTPDFVLTRYNLAIFIDGEQVHAHRQDRDEDLRKKLSDRHGLKVLSITYSSNTEAEKQRIIAEIKGAVQ